MKFILISAWSIIMPYFLAAQEIRMIIIDVDTREPLHGATIKTTGRTIFSAADGSFDLPADVNKIEVSFIGYISQQLDIKSHLSTIALKKDANSLQEVVMTANRTLQRRAEAPLAITTIGKQVMEDTKATQLDQLLNKVNGVYMVDLGNEQHEMSIRQPMTTKSLFLYLEDGIPIRTTGLYNHNALLEMNMVAIKQMEVIKGPASSLYGAEAIGGAINLITQAPPAQFSSKAQLQFSNTGYKRIDMQVGNTFGKFGLLISGYYADRHNGPIPHSDFHKTAISIRGDYAIGQHTKWINDITYIDYYSDMLGALDSIHFKNKDYRTPQTFTYRKVPALRFKSRFLHQWNSNSSSQLAIVYRDNSVEQNPSYRIKNIATDPSHADGEINESSFNTFMGLAQHTQRFRFANSKLIAGIAVDISPSRYHSNYISIQRDEQGNYINYNNTDSILSKYRTAILNMASYLHYEMDIVKGLKLTAAFRYDYYRYGFRNSLSPSAFTGAPSTTEHFKRLSPKAGFTYNLKGFGLYANYSEGFVPPQISELFTGVKVPYLGSQTFFNYEMGGWLSMMSNKLYIDWSLYLMKGSNEIITVKNPDGSSENRNSGQTRHTGIEYSIHYKPSKELSIRLSGANSKHIFIDYVEKGISYNKNEMPGGPRFIVNTELTYKPDFVKGFRISSEWQHLGAYFMDNANTKKYDGFDVLNMRIGYTIKDFDCWLNVMNLMDTYYSTFASKSGNTFNYTLGMPREFNIGIGYHFNKK